MRRVVLLPRQSAARLRQAAVAANRRALPLLAILALVGTAGPAWAQGTPDATPPTSPPAAAGAGAPQQKTPVDRVAVDSSGGPPALAEQLASAIAAWSKAAPGLVALTTDPKATSTIGYAAPALLGPDTLSLDLRTPGKPGVDVRLAGNAVAQHPMVLLHEVGVLLGLPEGAGGVMAFGVPASGEPTAPTKADVTLLEQQRTYAREDLDHDGKVDFYDLILFAQAYGSQGVNLPADFNGDGRVDDKDLALLEKAYTFSPPSQTAPGETQPGAPGTTSSPASPTGTAGGETAAPGSAPPAGGGTSGGSNGGAPATPGSP